MKGQSVYQNSNNTSGNNFSYMNYNQNQSIPSQYYQQQQNQQSSQQPLQQQNQNITSYSRSQSRHSHHQSENVNISATNNTNSMQSQNSKYVKQSTSSMSHTQSNQVYQNSQLRENYNNLSNNSNAKSNQVQQSQTGNIRPSTVANILNNNSTNKISQNAIQNLKQTNQVIPNNSKVNNENRIQNNTITSNQNTLTNNNNNVISSSINANNNNSQSNNQQISSISASLKASTTNTKNQLQKKRKTFECGGTAFSVDDHYEFHKQIGHGAYGVVCSGIDTKCNKKIAIKKITNAFEDLVDAKRIVREIKMLKFFDHENIIALHDIIVPEQRTDYNDIYIVTELMETDLHRVIYSRQELTDDHIQYFLYQTLRGMLYIHSANVMHRDLKPSNILVNKNCDLKVCDLGLARGFEFDEEDGKTEYVVTRWYRAPEVILKASKYTKSIDVWSIGCIFAELLGRTPLFPGKDYLEQIQRIIAILGTPTPEELSYITNEGALKYLKSLPKRTKQSWENLYPNANLVGLDLLSKMLTFNPNDRYTIEECLAHPYFEGLHNPEDEPTCPEVFDWAWDDFELTKERLQGMVYDEAIDYQKVKAAQQQQQYQQQQSYEN
ncbi:hypothetical protein ABPG74_010600 [Tetrahymena malaccensis]